MADTEPIACRPLPLNAFQHGQVPKLTRGIFKSDPLYSTHNGDPLFRKLIEYVIAECRANTGWINPELGSA